ncbi:MAG TPA: gephyrin-like molybdotransferase Glp [Candidatus Polarisedimenticolia bacterium]|nr:gephyrin-like molybdotransferase Glp [Candidatus Polarisedimenticolia bacterium]
MSEPIAVERALSIVLEATPVLPFESIDTDQALGRWLQEEIKADRDHPDFDKSLMDGYAVVAADLERDLRPLRVVQEIPAGTDPAGLRAVRPGGASRIMTGAPIPPGADAVLIVEETEGVEGDPESVRPKSAVRAGANIARRGADVRSGEVLLRAGEFIGAAEMGVIAACGRTRVRAGGRPRLAVLATGDELVEPENAPGPGQIRNSNGPVLRALALRAGAVTRYLGIAPDDERGLRLLIEDGLGDDVLVLSGGVSMGTRDLVGQTLRSLGVEILFDRVAIRPGKPFTFGRRGSALVFGCPGNPVSAYVIFQVFARAALRRMMGSAHPAPVPVRGVLKTPVRQRPGRAGYLQARAAWAGGAYEVEVIPSSGSADFVSSARGNSLAILPPDVTSLPAGASIETLLLDDQPDR